jgi:hypothetical protein
MTKGSPACRAGMLPRFLLGRRRHEARPSALSFLPRSPTYESKAAPASSREKTESTAGSALQRLRGVENRPAVRDSARPRNTSRRRPPPPIETTLPLAPTAFVSSPPAYDKMHRTRRLRAPRHRQPTDPSRELDGQMADPAVRSEDAAGAPRLPYRAPCSRITATRFRDRSSGRGALDVRNGAHRSRGRGTIAGTTAYSAATPSRSDKRGRPRVLRPLPPTSYVTSGPTSATRPDS